MTCVLILLITIFLFAKVLETKTSEVSVAANDSSIKNDMIVDENGCVSFEENDYFKKYIINLKDEIKDIDWKETKDLITIKMDKSKIENLAIKSKDKNIFSYITAKNENGQVLINIKKKFNKNYVYKDLMDGKKIVVLVAKLEKPYDYKVVIDAGHGEYDIGTSCGGIKEKDVTLKIGLYTLNNLTYNGCNVIFTREKDKMPRNARNEKEDVRARTAIANEEKADLFISIHVDDYKDKSLKGVTTYYNSQNGFQYEERRKLARLVSDEIVKSDGWNSRGVKSERFGVLRFTNMPSILIECGYMSNTEDRERISKDKVLKNLAINISQGILNYLNSNNKK